MFDRAFGILYMLSYAVWSHLHTRAHYYYNTTHVAEGMTMCVVFQLFAIRLISFNIIDWKLSHNGWDTCSMFLAMPHNVVAQIRHRCGKGNPKWHARIRSRDCVVFATCCCATSSCKMFACTKTIAWIDHHRDFVRSRYFLCSILACRIIRTQRHVHISIKREREWFACFMLTSAGCGSYGAKLTRCDCAFEITRRTT